MTFASLLQKTLHCSRYAKRVLEADPSLLNWLKSDYASPCSRADMQILLRQTGLDLDNETGLAQAVRRLRKQVMVKLILRDLNGLANLSEVMLAMTALAEICLQHAQACLMQTLQQQFGSPIGESSGAMQELLIVGMGKLGGEELNVSSDIDLIFVYPEDGQTDGAQVLTNHEFFTRLGRRLISLINELTADGYVFRVDMRLRPYGDSGALVTSFAALEEYLVSQGREWERYAWIKGHVVAPPETKQSVVLMQLVQPFVFRKYLDFGAIDSMRKLHAQIRQEVLRRDQLNNIKLGPGGIREIEFIAQVFQLIRGGSDARLRIRPTRRVLQQLGENNQLTKPVIAGLDEAYVFLRNLEHRLQYLDDQQTQMLPENTGDQEIIAHAMGYADYAILLKGLNHHRAMVSQQFEQVFGSPPSQRERREVPNGSAVIPAQQTEPNEELLWREGITAEELNAALEKLGYHNSSESAKVLLQLRDSRRYRQLPESSRQRMDKLVPQFVVLCAVPPAQQEQRLTARLSSTRIDKVAQTQYNRDQTLLRILKLLESISGRASYLAFLAEYPQVLQRLVGIANASVWACDYLIQHPILLDEFLDTREMYQPPEWQQIDGDLETCLNDCAGDAERQFDALHLAQQEQTFHLLAMDLQGLLPLEKLSDHLSDLANLLLHHVLKLSWATARKRHCDVPKFAIIAYGKLGGRELGYASDLDLIFLYDDDHPDAQENYARLAQRINTMLGSYTSSGRLYETDLRLRPNGASGLLVSSIDAFAEYQQKEAWVWEHQALTRARFSAGDAQIGAAFEKIRQQVLCQERDLATLGKEILEMRQKMHDGHPNNSGKFDIKHDTGGMVDIEFIVQYLVLAYAHQYPQLTANSGNLALLKLAGELGLIPVELAEQCRALYRALRQIQHRMRLNNLTPCRIEQGEIETASSRELWGRLFGSI